MSYRQTLSIWIWENKNLLRRKITQLTRRLRKQPKIIASLTSYPARINTVHIAIRSLLAQKTLPDCIVLWLYTGDFPHGENDLPTELRHLLSRDVIIKWVEEDLRPHKKYFWALQEYSEDLVLTFDDDLVYPNTYITELMNAHRAYPRAVAAIRAHLITFKDDGSRKPYDQWIYEAPAFHPEMVGNPSLRLFATSGAGTLFPPHVMPANTFDLETIRETSLNADDVWLKVMQVIGRVPVVCATQNQVIANIPLSEAAAQQRLSYIPNTQEEALCHVNTENGGNDVILAQTLMHPTIVEAIAGCFDDLVKDENLNLYANPDGFA